MKRSGFRKKTLKEVIEAQEKASIKKISVVGSKISKKIIKKKRKKPKKRIDWGISEWKKEAWKHFTKMIKARDKYKCFTCGKEATGSGMHGGHYITKATCPPKLYFDETNTHAQCYRCNINLSGNWVEYERRMIDKYGAEHVAELKRRQKQEQGQKVDKEFYKELVEHCKQELKNYEQI